MVRLDGRDMTAEPTRPELIPPCAICNHPAGYHHLTEKAPRKHTRCTAHEPEACPCTQYRPVTS